MSIEISDDKLKKLISQFKELVYLAESSRRDYEAILTSLKELEGK